MKLLKKLMALIETNRPAEYSRFVNACDKWVTYTDGFKVVRIPNNTDLRGAYSKDQLNKFVVAGVNTPTEHTRYPDVERAMPDESKLTLKIDVNAKFLISILKVLVVGSKSNAVRLHIDPNNPSGVVLVTNHKVRGRSEGVLIPIAIGVALGE